MTEAYTFSRALHLMRYGGKKMRPVGYNFYYFVHEDSLMVNVGCDTHNYRCVDNYRLNSMEIMGSWIEVKDES